MKENTNVIEIELPINTINFIDDENEVDIINGKTMNDIEIVKLITSNIISNATFIQKYFTGGIPLESKALVEALGKIDS